MSVLRVGIIGGEASGKSTLAKALAAHCSTAWVQEYLREFVLENRRTPFPHEQLHIATTQIQRERAALSSATRFLFCDTTPLMTAIYSRYYFGQADDELAALAASHRYDFTIVTAPTNPWCGDGLMRDGDAIRQAVHAMVIQTLQTTGTPYLLVDGDVAQRVQQAVAYLSA